MNADEIAKGLSPFQPEKVAIEVGRIMLNRINDLFHDQINFAFETTLATKIYKSKIMDARKSGYNSTLLFFWLIRIELTKERVRTRVLEGGHFIVEDVIERRYVNGIKNLFEIYLDIVDEALIFDNAEGTPILIAEKIFGQEVLVHEHKSVKPTTLVAARKKDTL